MDHQDSAIPQRPGERGGDTRVTLEIERVFLLRGVPDLPPAAEVYAIEQGYLPDSGDPTTGLEGRLRRAFGPAGPDGPGPLVCTHTVKRGFGIQREETERRIEPEEFELAWAATEGRRLRKTRYRVASTTDDLAWEIDVFDDLEVVLAEIEIPSTTTPVTIPAWLQAVLIREVTDEPEFRNYALARRVHGF